MEMKTLQAVYGFQIDLNTSFTGEDSLDISIDAGNAQRQLNLNLTVAEFDQLVAADALTVDGISYTFPLGDKQLLSLVTIQMEVCYLLQLVFMADHLTHLMIAVT